MARAVRPIGRKFGQHGEVVCTADPSSGAIAFVRFDGDPPGGNPVDIADIEHVTRPHFEVGDLIEVRPGHHQHAGKEGTVQGINPIPRTAMVALIGYGIVTFPFDAIVLKRPVQRLGRAG